MEEKEAEWRRRGGSTSINKSSELIIFTSGNKRRPSRAQPPASINDSKNEGKLQGKVRKGKLPRGRRRGNEQGRKEEEGGGCMNGAGGGDSGGGDSLLGTAG